MRCNAAIPPPYGPRTNDIHAAIAIQAVGCPAIAPDRHRIGNLELPIHGNDRSVAEDHVCGLRAQGGRAEKEEGKQGPTVH
jgi:hypothetical protein